METINRNNYEEFFLLYIDNELDAQSKLAVENFIQQNPDLEIELQMLQQVKALPEDISFGDKDFLLRTEGNSINETNYEEYFLLYIDNELSAAKKEEVEKYVLQHPKLQEEFTTLKQAVLTPEVISYGNKEDLYRIEKRRVISIRTWRLAAAAIFIGVCALGVWMWQQNSNYIRVAATTPTKDSSKENIATTKNLIDSVHQTIQNQQPTVAQQQKENKEEKIEQQVSSIKKEKNNSETIAIIKKKKEEPVKNDVAVTINDEQPIKVQKSIITPRNNPKEPPSSIDRIADVTDNIQQKKNDVASLQTSDIKQPDNDYKISPVAYKEINTNDEDNSLHVGMLDLNKTKVKNLFKKAGRMFSKKNNDSNDDGKLQVANFEINTKQQ